jgi:hypothetical protein
MQHGVVLNVGMVADDDAVDVAAQHRAVPNTRMRPDGHVAQDDGSPGKVNTPVEFRLLAQERVKLLRGSLHARILTVGDVDVAAFSLSTGAFQG